MSIVSYNGITLPYAHHTDFRQEAVYDDEGGVDRIYTRFDITVECVLNADYAATISPTLLLTPAPVVGPVSRNAADIMDVIRTRLLQPRRRLSIQCNSSELVPQKQQGLTGIVDAKNGPQPQSCSVTQLTNVTFLLVWRCTAHYWENPSTNQATGNATVPVDNQVGSPVLFNRWTETVDFDSSQYSRRTRDGKFVIRSDNIFGALADQIRSAMAVVGVPKGFLRESSSYTVTPDGLGLRYHIVDKEQFRMPPPPAFEAHGEYVETSVGPTGAQRWGEIRLRLKGDRTTPQDQLVATAVALCSAKTNSPGATFNGVGFVKMLTENLAISVNLYDNEVECRMRIRLKPAGSTGTGNERFQGQWGLDYRKLVQMPPDFNNPSYTPNYQDRGTAFLLLQAASYYDPSLVNNQLVRQTGQLSNGLPIGAAGTNPEA